MGFNLFGTHIEESVNALQYGVKGDGKTNDTAALNALFASEHERIYLPAGTYIITGTLVIPFGKTVFGDGESTVIKLGYPYSLSSYTWRSEEGHLTNSPYLYVGGNCILSDFAVYGDSTQPKDEMQIAVLVHGDYTVCRNLTTRNINYFPESVQDKVHPYGPINLCNGYGMFIFGANHVSVRDCRFFNNAYQGIGTEDAEDVTIDKCYVGDSFRTGIQIHRGSKRIIVSGCIVNNTSEFKASDITLHGAPGDGNVDRLTISDCILGPRFGDPRVIFSISSIWGYENNIVIKGCNIQTAGMGINLCTDKQGTDSPTTNVCITGNLIDSNRRCVTVDGDYVVVTGNLLFSDTADISVTGEHKMVANNLYTNTGG